MYPVPFRPGPARFAAESLTRMKFRVVVQPSATRESVRTVLNALHPDLMTPAERLDEIAEILAAGIVRARERLRALRGSTAEQVRVDFSPRRSGRARPSGQRRRRT